MPINPAEAHQIERLAVARIKTTIARKMQAEAAPDLRVIYMDIGAVSRAAELVERLAQAIRVHLGATKKATGWLAEQWSALGGLEVGGILRLPESKGPSRQ